MILFFFNNVKGISMIHNGMFYIVFKYHDLNIYNLGNDFFKLKYKLMNEFFKIIIVYSI